MHVRIVLAAALTALPLAVAAQESQLPPEPCRAAESFEVWIRTTQADRSVKLPPDLALNVAVLQGRLTALCASLPDDASFADGSAAAWLRQADETLMLMASAVSRALEHPLSIKARQYVHTISFWVVTFDAALLEKRAQAYEAVQVQEKEVVRTVSVPAQCPRCPDLTCPPVPVCDTGPTVFDIVRAQREERHDRCISSIKSGVRNWRDTAERLARAAPQYDANGAVYGLAASLNECMDRQGFVHCEDTLDIRAHGWLEQVRSAVRQDNQASTKASTIIRGQLDAMETDIEVRLRACGGRR